jgi:hypothetical protein
VKLAPRTQPDNTQGDVLQALVHQVERMTEQLLRQSDSLEHLRANTINSVLFSGTVRLDQLTGVAVLDGWTIPAGSIWVSNRGATTLTVIAGNAGFMGGSPPVDGAGVFGLPASYAETYAVDATSVTLVGQPDSLVSITVWTCGSKPYAGGVA